MSILSLIEKLTYKKFNETQKLNVLGSLQACYLAYSADASLRERSASGGAVTALLLNLLESGQIDGALVTEGYVENGKFHARFMIATTKEELLRSQGSKYVTVFFNRDALPLIRAFDGKLAVVALPCDTSNLRRICERAPELDEKIKMVITLFCGHLSQPELTEHVIARQTKEKRSQLTTFQHRAGHWRGEMVFGYADGTQERSSFKKFSTMQNLYFFCEEKCLHCHDHFGYDGDISAGDLWHSSMKGNANKKTALISRSQRGETLLQETVKTGVLKVNELTTDLLLEGHSRSVRGHYNVSARAKAGKLLGFKIKDAVHAKVNLFDWLTGFIILFNYRLSMKNWGRKFIYAMPKSVWKLYLYIFKGVETL